MNNNDISDKLSMLEAMPSIAPEIVMLITLIPYIEHFPANPNIINRLINLATRLGRDNNEWLWKFVASSSDYSVIDQFLDTEPLDNPSLFKRLSTTLASDPILCPDYF